MTIRSLSVRAMAFMTLAALSVTVGACASADPTAEELVDQEAPGVEMNELTSTKIVGDWKLLPNGEECLAALQGFYPAKFGVSVPVAGPGSFQDCAAHGACKIWLDKIPSSTDWERIPNDGTRLPTTYDMIVYPPISGDPWGHIASVDHVEGKTIYVMDDNYVAHHAKSQHPHTVSWKAYGWYHLKKLGGSPPPPPSNSCVVGGLYCGGDKITGDASTLFRCDGSTTTKIEACHHGCIVRSGKDDACGCVPNSNYCGGDVVTGDASTLYECLADGVSTKILKTCANGCQVNSGASDACK